MRWNDRNCVWLKYLGMIFSKKASVLWTWKDNPSGFHDTICSFPSLAASSSMRCSFQGKSFFRFPRSLSSSSRIGEERLPSDCGSDFTDFELFLFMSFCSSASIIGKGQVKWSIAKSIMQEACPCVLLFIQCRDSKSSCFRPNYGECVFLVKHEIWSFKGT